MHPSLSLEKSKIRILLLEGVDPSAVETLKKAGYTNIEYSKKALDGQELLEKIRKCALFRYKITYFLNP